VNAAEYRLWWEANTSVPYGFCWCGCGERTRLAPQSDTKRGVVKGEPVRFLQGHHNRTAERKPRKLGGAKDAEICRRYEAGERIVDIGAALGIHKTTVHRVLRRNGISPNRRLSEADNAEICRRYEAGEPGSAIAKDFGVSKEAVYRVLETAGVARRPWHGPPPILTANHEDEAINRYAGGKPAKAIAEDFSVSDTTILKVLDRRGIPRNHRTVYESVAQHYAAMRSLSDAQEAEVCRRYEAGESGPVIAKALGIGEHAVSNALKRNGVEKRPAVAGDRLAAEVEDEVCRLYLAGEGPAAISRQTGVGVSTIQFVLVRNGVDRHHPQVRYTAKQKAAAVERYGAGERVRVICDEVGVTPTSLYKLLRERGNEPSRATRRLEWEETEAAKVIRNLPAYRKWRQTVLARDGRACQDCGAHSTFNNPLHVPHLRPYIEILTDYQPISVEQAEEYAALWDVDNGLTLCEGCHWDAHGFVRSLSSPPLQ
jgi:DNA invertase Pin-like site-specific DNA recombinase